MLKSRSAKLKKRYIDMMLKCQQQVLIFNENEMKKKTKLCETYESLCQRQKEREDARVAIESVKQTIHFSDDLQAEREFLKIIRMTDAS